MSHDHCFLSFFVFLTMSTFYRFFILQLFQGFPTTKNWRQSEYSFAKGAMMTAKPQESITHWVPPQAQVPNHTFMITVETIANYHRWSLVPRSPNVWDWSKILIWQERRISGENLPHLVSIREGGSGESCGFERLKVFWSLKLIVILNMKYG